MCILLYFPCDYLNVFFLGPKRQQLTQRRSSMWEFHVRSCDLKDIPSMDIKYQYLGRPKYQTKKKKILKNKKNYFFEDPGWERLENLKYRNFCRFRVLGFFTRFGRPFHYMVSHSKYANLAEDMIKAIPKRIGGYAWAKLSRRVENMLFATHFL